jgi:hypothetical protein
LPDPIGPTGQPNPFQQGSNPSITPNVEMGQAKHAMDDFMTHLEESINKQFNIREKAIKNITTGEESYWKMATRYADTFSGVLTKHHDIRMVNLKREQLAKEQAIRNDVKNEEEAQKQILKIRTDYAMKEAQYKQQHRGRLELLEQTETIFGGVQRAAGIAVPTVGGVLSEFGTLISSAATAAAFFSVAVISAAKATVAWQERTVELTKTTAGLVAAGGPIGMTRGAEEALRTQLFGGVFEKLLSPTQQRAGLGVIGQAPALLGEATGNTEKFQKAMFMFGNIMPNSTELLEMFSKNSKELGLNLDELANVFTVSRLAAMRMSHSQKEFNINQKDTIDMYLSLQKSFRTFTIDGHVAGATLLGLSSYLKDVAKGPQEKRQFAEAIGGGIAGLRFSQLAGMFAFTRGGELPNEKQMQDVFRNPGALMGRFLGGITSQFGRGSPEALMVKGQLQEQFFPNLPMRLIPKFDELINALSAPGITDKEAQTKMAQFDKETAKVEESGRKALTDATTGLTEIENKLLNLWNGVLNDPNKTRTLTEIAVSAVSPVAGAAVSVARSMQGARHK